MDDLALRGGTDVCFRASPDNPGTTALGREQLFERHGGAKIAFLHTSGYASAGDLSAFAAAMGARMVVPVHGADWDRETHGFANLRRLEDGERLVVTASESGDRGAPPA